MPAEERLQIRLPAFEQSPDLEGEHGGQHQKYHDENVGQGRREIAAQFTTEDHHNLVQAGAPSVLWADVPAGGGLPAARGNPRKNAARAPASRGDFGTSQAWFAITERTG